MDLLKKLTGSLAIKIKKFKKLANKITLNMRIYTSKNSPAPPLDTDILVAITHVILRIYRIQTVIGINNKELQVTCPWVC